MDDSLDFFGDDLWGNGRTGADIHAWIGMDVDSHLRNLERQFAGGFGVKVFTDDGIEYGGCLTFYLCTVMSMDTLRCIVEGGGPFPCGRHGSFDRQPIGGRTRNRSRQPTEFWRQRVRHNDVRRHRLNRLAYKLDWYRYGSDSTVVTSP